MKKFFTVFLTFVITGCSSEVRTSAMENKSEYRIYNDKTGIYKNKGFYVGESNDNIERFALKNRSIQDRETGLERSVKKLIGIDDAEVTIIGDIAVVTVMLSGEATDKKLDVLKKDIETLTKGLDSAINHVSVVF